MEPPLLPCTEVLTVRVCPESTFLLCRRTGACLRGPHARPACLVTASVHHVSALTGYAGRPPGAFKDVCTSLARGCLLLSV